MRRLVVLELASELYGIDVAHVAAIVEPMYVAAVPGSTPIVMGVANLRGAMLPVLDLRPWLSLPQTPFGPDAGIVVVDADGTKAGIMADRVTHLARLDEGRFVEAPATKSDRVRPYLREAAQLDHDMLVVFDVAKFLEDTAGHMIVDGTGADDWRKVA